VFAGPFRGYGLLLILSQGEGYHILLAGMSRLYAVTGQPVLAGEPVGEMGPEGSDTTLYVELRRQGEPINPLSWITADKGKVSG
jgi:septal ring factor EnvC (AmiA/AmiB activator)